MSRTKTILAVLVLAAMVGIVPAANAATAKTVVLASGASAMWQTIGLAAFNNGACPTAKVKVKPPCFHYTSSSNFNLNDTRPKKVSKARGGPGVTAVDGGTIWIVWDSSATTNIWAYLKVDSVVGVRCFFANPVCNVSAPSTGFPSAGNAISSVLWGTDSTPPANVQALFTAAAGVKVNAAATDIRPEDAAWAACRVNSALGNGTPGYGDGLDGLGYNPNNPSGTCPVYSTKKTALGQLVGAPIQSGYPTSPSAPTNVLAFNISGQDPFTNLAVPAYSTISVGASPITFVFERSGSEASGGLVGLTNATDTQLQTLFSGANCDAADPSIFAIGTSPNPIAVFLRDPLAGTYNTIEETLFRRPVETTPSNAVIGISQETNVAAANPVKAAPCVNGIGIRSRAIGSSEEIKSVQNSFKNNSVDGIGYTFFSFGNVSSIANSTTYGYTQLNGVDPLFASYTGTDPGEPGGGVLPGSKNVCGGGGFPCPESAIWTGKLSFPNIRNGSYGQWSLLRFIATTASTPNVTDLILTSQAYVVTSVPDFVPALGVPSGCTGTGCTDPGLQLFRAHYQQLDGDGNPIGPVGNDGTFNANFNPTNGDTGGDMGGCVGSTDPAFGVGNGIIQIGLNGGTLGTSCSAAPVR